MLKTRVITGAGLTLCFAAVFALSRYKWVLPIVAAILSLMSLYELQKATGFLKNDSEKVVAAEIVVLLAVVPLPDLPIWTAILFLTALVIFLWLMSRVGMDTTVSEGVSWVILLMLPIFFRSMAALRRMEHGLYLLITAILTAVITDVFAYFAGRAFGKHKLAPALSPKKTVEGSIGGTLAAAALLLGITAAIQGTSSIRYDVLAIYLVLGSLIGQFGDLALSSIKRITGIKDYGNLLPGHGGILDRFDSALFVLPFSYLFNLYFPWII